MGPGFDFNLGGFALPEIDMEELNSGIAAQVAKYLAEQDLVNSTNEFEKDVAENTIDQITDYETGIGSLPPVVEQVMKEMAPTDNVIEAVSDRDFGSPMFAPSLITEPVERIDTYTPNYMGGEDERAVGRENERMASMSNTGIASIPTAAMVQNVVGSPPIGVTPVDGFTDIRRMPNIDPNFRRIVQSPVSNLIRQQRAAYNSALQNPVYNPQPEERTPYVRPMSAAEFGAVPAKNGGSLSSGLGGLPPMQQNDKLTQLFAKSFSPRR